MVEFLEFYFSARQVKYDLNLQLIRQLSCFVQFIYTNKLFLYVWVGKD